jgi:hypothetical protein
LRPRLLRAPSVRPWVSAAVAVGAHTFVRPSRLRLRGRAGVVVAPAPSCGRECSANALVRPSWFLSRMIDRTQQEKVHKEPQRQLCFCLLKSLKPSWLRPQLLAALVVASTPLTGVVGATVSFCGRRGWRLQLRAAVAVAPTPSCGRRCCGRAFLLARGANALVGPSYEFFARDTPHPTGDTAQRPGQIVVLLFAAKRFY